MDGLDHLLSVFVSFKTATPDKRNQDIRKKRDPTFIKATVLKVLYFELCLLVATYLYRPVHMWMCTDY